MRPKGLLFDYGGTLVEEVRADSRAGNAWVLSRAAFRPAHVTLEDVLARADRIRKEVAARREQVHLETPWPALTRLIYDSLGIRFDEPIADLEIGFWKASTRTLPMPGAREALDQFHDWKLPMAVVSNTCFSERAVRYELDQHGLCDHVAFVMVSADYAVRKPTALLFELGAARLGLAPADIWFIGDRADADVAGANAAGMTSVWLRQNGHADAGSTDADVVIADWHELIGRIADQRGGRTGSA